MNFRVKEIADGIKSMKIRGAGRIGRAGAEALKIFTEDYNGQNFEEDLKKTAILLKNTRPTAISLENAIEFVVKGKTKQEVKKRAEKFIEHSHWAVNKIGEICEERIPDNCTILTHCNSSVVIEALIKAHKNGKNIKVFSTETRPWGQGYISSKKLAEAGVDVTLIVDSAARHFMKDVDLVLVGADTVASNGVVINKIGTSTISLIAHETRVPFIVLAESYKFSRKTLIGKLVEIEEREPSEIINPEKLKNVKIRNLVFDATPACYIDTIITEFGAISPYMAYRIIKEYVEGDKYGIES